jgi:hypothetical protein
LEKLRDCCWVDTAPLPQALEAIVHDADDRKFVEASLAVNPHPPIVNASDSDWLDCQDALADEGVEVVQLIGDWLRTWSGE